jgi:hypothetical protein
MSYPTQPAFVAFPKGWDEEILQHPMLQFLHEHEKDFDAKKPHDAKPYYSADMHYQKSNGQSFHGAAAVAQAYADYEMFVAHYHEPFYGVVTETEGGYRLAGFAKMYVNLPGEGDRNYEDLQGRKWECVAEGAFLFEAIKDETGVQGFRVKSWKIYADPTPILGVALKKGIMPVEALMG